MHSKKLLACRDGKKLRRSLASLEEAGMARAKIAELLLDTLVAAGVKRVYGLAGDSLNGLTDAIRKRDDLQWIHVRHEETAAFAAGAEAHLTGKLTVCAGS